MLHFYIIEGNEAEIKLRKMNAAIKVTSNGYSFLHFYNSTCVYSLQGFSSERKARNYAKKFNYALCSELPQGIAPYDNQD